MIENVLLNNFKAIHHMDTLPLQPFAVFIGNNGSGKSSVLEALRLLQNAIKTDLGTAFAEWGGLDKVRNYNASPNYEISTYFVTQQVIEPILIAFECTLNEKKFLYKAILNESVEHKNYVVEHEELVCNGNNLIFTTIENFSGNNVAWVYQSLNEKKSFSYPANILLLSNYKSHEIFLHPDVKLFREFIENWQFLSLNAHEMGKPVLQNRLTKDIRLDYDGKNIAEYLLWLRGQDEQFLDCLISELKFVLPYLSELQPTIKDTFNREVELLFYENNDNNKKPIPGWLLSSGTLRIVAILSMFITPRKPSVLFIDEVENGLDPRTIGMLINHIQDVFADKSMQVVVTTHSPYFLDLVPLESIIVSEKDNHKTSLHIPIDEMELDKWKAKFSPGKLYTMGKLTN